MILDSEAAVRRALAQVGRPDGAGECLANVYRWFGGPAWSSTGPGAGKFGQAIDAWNYAAKRRPGSLTPPAGVPVYFGTDTPRTDANAKAGDVALSIGGGRIVCTDSPTGNTGIMTILGRAAQVRRNYLGSADDFLGYDTTAGLATVPPLLVIPTPKSLEGIMSNSSAFTIYNHPTEARHFIAGAGTYLAIGSAFEGEAGLDGGTILAALTADGMESKNIDSVTYDRLNVMYAAIAGKRAA